MKDLFEEIKAMYEALDPNDVASPLDKVQPNEEVIGTISETDYEGLRKLWGIATVFGRRQDEAEINAKYAKTWPDRDKFTREAKINREKHNAVLAIILASLQIEFDIGDAWAFTLGENWRVKVITTESMRESLKHNFDIPGLFPREDQTGVDNVPPGIFDDRTNRGPITIEGTDDPEKPPAADIEAKPDEEPPSEATQTTEEALGAEEEPYGPGYVIEMGGPHGVELEEEPSHEKVEETTKRR